MGAASPVGPRSLRLAAALLAFGTVLGACGRSAPDGATGAADNSAADPAMAGVQVVSASPVVAPGATSSTVVATTVVTTPPAPAGSYTVESGDTLSVIAQQFGVSVAALSEANNITDVDSIRPGQKLIIPGP